MLFLNWLLEHLGLAISGHVAIGTGLAMARSYAEPTLAKHARDTFHGKTEWYTETVVAAILIWEAVLPVWGFVQLCEWARRAGKRRLAAQEKVVEDQRQLEREIAQLEQEDRKEIMRLAREIDALPLQRIKQAAEAQAAAHAQLLADNARKWKGLEANREAHDHVHTARRSAEATSADFGVALRAIHVIPQDRG